METDTHCIDQTSDRATVQMKVEAELNFHNAAIDHCQFYAVEDR